MICQSREYLWGVQPWGSLYFFTECQAGKTVFFYSFDLVAHNREYKTSKEEYL